MHSPRAAGTARVTLPLHGELLLYMRVLAGMERVAQTGEVHFHFCVPPLDAAQGRDIDYLPPEHPEAETLWLLAQRMWRSLD